MTQNTYSTASTTAQLATTATPATSSPLAERAREWLAKYLPSKIPFKLPFDAHLEHWEPQANYVIRSTRTSDTEALTLSLAQQFASDGGHVIWMGTTEDLHRISVQLTFKIAGIELPAAGTSVELDAIEQCKLGYAHEQIGKLWIDFCNVDDCGDADIEQEFLASVSSFKPTLIVVDESIFDDVTLNPFEVLVRQTHALRMVEELRGTNPMGSVLWHLPMSDVVEHSVHLPSLAQPYPTIYLTTSGTPFAEPDLELSA